jgi:hypothetical protein
MLQIKDRESHLESCLHNSTANFRQNWAGLAVLFSR